MLSAASTVDWKRWKFPAAAALTSISVAGYFLYRRRQRQHSVAVEDYQAAFPTAQWVCAMRAVDAQSETPKIGRNINAGPDTLAATLTGEAGFRILDASVKMYSSTRSNLSLSLVERTQMFDQKWMAALDAGCKQFVVLAAGLDARAWRMPKMDESVTVFEVDVPNSFAYKNKRLATLQTPPSLSCSRIAVMADLSCPEWITKLVNAGFDPSQRSFFLIEGLLMYLPPGAPENLLRATANLMSRGSVLSGDSFVASLALTDQRFVTSLGSRWTWEFGTRSDVDDLMTEIGLSGTVIENVGGGAQSDGQRGDDGYVAAKAKRMQSVLLSLGAWPEGAKYLTVPKLIDGKETAVRALMAQIVDDKQNFQGLADEDEQTKAEIVEVALATPLEMERHGTRNLSEALLAEARLICDDPRMQKSWVGRWWTILVFMFTMMRRARKKGGASYVIYTAKKA